MFHYRKFHLKQTALLILISSILFIYSGCIGNSSPSDKEALRLVSEYYLFYGNGEDVDVRIVKREAYNEGCKCYPIKLQVYRSRASNVIKTFYFFKGSSGTFSLKKYAGAVKT
jgi:hypothetical protein